jgi:hypothetical protein
MGRLDRFNPNVNDPFFTFYFLILTYFLIVTFVPIPVYP